MKVLLIGAGRYGNGLVGRKYREKEFGAELGYVVDPKIDEIKAREDYRLGSTPTYRNLEEIPKESFDKNLVAEIALIPNHIVDVYARLINLGARKVILPKPVAQDFDSFEKIKEISDKNNVQTAVASNWHYSKITEFLRAILDKTKGEEVSDSDILDEYKHKLKTVKEGFEIEKVEIEYNKKEEVLTIDPPSQELPHALQIAYSCGLTDFENSNFIVDKDKQTESRVHVKVETPHVKDGIEINSDLNMGERLNKRRERIVRIYLNDDDPEADIVADYDAQFDQHGNCLKKPKISYKITKGDEQTIWSEEITEDNMNTMYEKIFSYFRGENKGIKEALTLEKYEPISRAICTIQELWAKCTRGEKE